MAGRISKIVSYWCWIWFSISLDFTETATCSSGCEVYKNNCYVKLNGTMTNPIAQAACKTVGGTLPTFISNAEATDFSDYRNITFTNITKVWTGYYNYVAHTATSPGIWRADNGTGCNMTVAYWGGGEPDNGLSTGIAGEWCVAFNDQFVDVLCSRTRNAICMCAPPVCIATSTTTTTSTTSKTSTSTSTTSSTSTSSTTTTSTTTTIPTTTSTTATTTTLPATTSVTATTAILPTTTTTTTNPTTTTSTTSITTTLPTTATTTTTPTTTSTATIPVTTATTTSVGTTTATSTTTVTTTPLASTTTSTTAKPSNITCPCANGGICENLAKGDNSCTCVGNWVLGDKRICTKYGFPKDAAGIASFVAQTTGCSTIVALLSITVGAYVIVGDRAVQSVLIFLSDTSILIAHVLIYTCRTPFITDLSDLSCKIVAFCIQLFALCHFSFLLFQSLHAYSLTTNVNTKGWWPLAPLITVAVGIGLPALVMGISAALYFDQFNLPWSCLVNYNSPLSYFFTLPAICMGIATVILSESAGMDSRKRGRLLIQPNSEWLSAQLGQRSSVVIYLFSLLAFIFTSTAVYNLSVYLSTVAFALNVTFAIFIFFFHSLENVKIRKTLKRGWDIIRCKSKAK